MSRKLDLLIVGGGAFGTALAMLAADRGVRPALWVRRPELAAEINEEQSNSRYLPGAVLPPGIEASTELAALVPRARVILMVVPSRHFRGVARELGDSLRGDQILVHATKGIEVETGARMSEVLRQETCARKIGVVSGPNLARELAEGQPAGTLIASRYDEVIDGVQALFAGSRLRVYGAHDVIGAEVAGAFKNIVALAAGALTGMGLGDNTRSLLITRGLSEMARYGVAQGAEVFTFGGLAGAGDLMATCTSPLSRNHQVGTALARGEALAEIRARMTHVAEGVPTTQAVKRHARSLGIELPIVEAVHDVLYDELSTAHALERLASLPVGDELAALRY